MGFVYYITLFVFIEDWVGLQSSAGSLNALIFTFFSSLCLVSFLASVLIDPGQVPASYVPDLEQTRASDQQPNKNVSFLCFNIRIVFSLVYACFVRKYEEKRRF